jgi:hypothetical protein
MNWSKTPCLVIAQNYHNLAGREIKITVAGIHERICASSDAPCGPLNETWEFIAADNSRAADGFLDEIHDAIRALVAFPRLGHIRNPGVIAAFLRNRR